jgi:hypothetical protein
MTNAGSQPPAQAQSGTSNSASTVAKGTTGNRRKQSVVLNIQGWAAVAAVVVSATALVVTLATTRDQALTNDSQRQLNDQKEQEYQTREASQVAWSSPLAAAQHVIIEIENLSRVFIKGLVLLSGSGLAAVLPGDLPACSSVEVTLSTVFGNHSPEFAMSWVDGTLYFHERQRFWALDSDGLHPARNTTEGPMFNLAQELGHHGPPMVVSLYENAQIAAIAILPASAVRWSLRANCGAG